MRAPFALVLLACLAAASVGCRRHKAAPEKGRSKTSATADAGSKERGLRGQPKTASELPTTSEAIYLANLDGQITELERLLRERPELATNVQKLSSALYVRGRFRGNLEEIARAIDLATRCVDADVESSACVLTRAEQQQSLHRFRQARADLELARKRGASGARLLELETELDWNDGRYDRAIEAIRRARRERPNTGTWQREAQLEHDLGAYELSDRAFEAAEDLIVDTAPLPVAHLYVQRGVAKSEQGHLEEAIVFFREATARMPSYVAAQEHLAEALHEAGKDAEAIAIYESVVARSDDPEFMHVLAELYTSNGKVDEGRALAAKARKRYDELLGKFPEAMYWHASEFFRDVGDKKKALDLLQKNARLRPNATAFVALARAELENEHVEEAHVAIDKALAMPLRSINLFETGADVYTKLGHSERAASLRAEAKKLGPARN